MTELSALDRKKLELVRLDQQYRQLLNHAFDGLRPESRPTDKQLSILSDTERLVFWILGSNRSGKSALGGRIASWWFAETHPYMSRPPEWGTGPLQILICGRLGEQMESELWERKIKPFLRPGTYREVRSGQALQRVINTINGNRIIFLSHHDAVNAREKVQAFTAHVVWLDEMPSEASLVTELRLRAVSSRGRFYATFTPLLRNEDIRKLVDTPHPMTRRDTLLITDNPSLNAPEIESELRAMSASEAEFRARMFGEWYTDHSRVTPYDRAQHRRPLPDTYSPQAWRHVAVLDPAASGLAGLTVWGEDPTCGRWYCVLAKLIKGDAAILLLELVERAVAPYRLVARWTDCNPAGFYKEAARQGIAWRPFTDKNDRKLDTLNKFNTMLVTGRMVLTPGTELLEEDLIKAAWSDKAKDRIVNPSALHLLDTARYAADVLPAWDPNAHVPLTPHGEIRAAWRKTKAARAEAQQAKILQRKGIWRTQSRWRSWSSGH